MTKWTPSICTGVLELDGHHQEICCWLAELESATEDDRVLLGVYAITRLKNLVREHFSAEERLMAAAGYPRLEEHMAEHAEFLVKLQELQRKSIEQAVSMEAVIFLENWFSNHMADADMAYVPYLHCDEMEQQVAG